MKFKPLIILLGLLTTLSCGITDSVDTIEKNIESRMAEVDLMIKELKAQLAANAEAVKQLEELTTIFTRIDKFEQTTKDQIDRIVDTIDSSLGKYDELFDEWSDLRKIIYEARDKVLILLFFKDYTVDRHIQLHNITSPEETNIYSSFSNIEIQQYLSISKYALLINTPGASCTTDCPQIFHFCVMNNINENCFSNVEIKEDGAFSFDFSPNRDSDVCKGLDCTPTPNISPVLKFNVSKDQAFSVEGYNSPPSIIKATSAR